MNETLNILELRTATSFRIYVPVIDALTFLTIIASVFAIRSLKQKQLFNKPTNHLIVSNIICQNIHNFSYSYIETWSLYRSLVYSTDVNNIMFQSWECYYSHVFNSCSRILLIYIEISLNIDRILCRVWPIMNETSRPAVLLIGLTFIAAYATGITIHLIYPPPMNTTTSCFREIDLTVNLDATNLLFYSMSAFICLALDIFMMVKLFKGKRQEKKSYNLAKKYNSLEEYYSLAAVSSISIIQMICTSFYSVSMFVANKLNRQVPNTMDVNTLRWCFTTPYSSFLIPCQILFVIWWIERKRRCRIQKIRNQIENSVDYFYRLDKLWNKSP